MCSEAVVLYSTVCYTIIVLHHYSTIPRAPQLSLLGQWETYLTKKNSSVASNSHNINIFDMNHNFVI